MTEKSRRLWLLKDECKKAGANCVVITNAIMNEGKNPNFFWLTNCNYGSVFYWEFRDNPRIIANSIEAPLCRKAWVKCEIGNVEDILKSMHGMAAFDASHTNVNFYNKINAKPFDVSDKFRNFRRTKSGYEIKCIKRACDITGSIFSEVFRMQKGKTERRIFSFARMKIAEMGLEEAFDPIVASGSNIRSPHHIPTDKRHKGALLVDLGVRFGGYCSDVTRTYGSSYTRIGEKIHEKLKEVIREGVSCAEADKVSRQAMGTLAKTFVTSLGHGIGISVHEDPRVSSKSNDILKKGDVITIEPGIYLKNGMRLENVYLVGKNKCDNLTDW
ncbi:MAG: M24 family metallopeptidase [Candidatus Aenigmarchaeota archaeon]|nr:M24 family metallopeptidase [Candidatus Aenigmarchaeota archaeon]